MYHEINISTGIKPVISCERGENTMPKTFKFTKEKTALIVVDLQNDFVRQGAPLLVEEALATLAPTKKLIDFARANNMPIVFLKFVTGKTPSLLWNWSPAIEADQCCQRGFERYYPDIDRVEQCSDVVEELKPILPEDYVIEKYHYSAFRNTSLVDVLRSEGADTVIVTGTVTQICVADSIHDGTAEGFQMIAISDCVSTWDSMQQQSVLENVAYKYGMVMTSDEVIEALN